MSKRNIYIESRVTRVKSQHIKPWQHGTIPSLFILSTSQVYHCLSPLDREQPLRYVSHIWHICGAHAVPCGKRYWEDPSDFRWICWETECKPQSWCKPVSAAVKSCTFVVRFEGDTEINERFKKKNETLAAQGIIFIGDWTKCGFLYLFGI